MVVGEAALAAGWDEISFFDDGMTPASAVALGQIAGGLAQLLGQAGRYDGLVVALGNNALRLDIQSRLVAAGGTMATIVHPAASVSKRAQVGAGSVVLAGAVIVIGADIGEGVIVNTAASIDHDCILGDGVHFSPGAHLAGGVVVGARTWLGIGCTILEKTTIGTDVIVGAGAVVTKPCADGVTVVGNPARSIVHP